LCVIIILGCDFVESRIYLFKDRNDYVKRISDDNIINITGSVGSGKSTYGKKYRNNSDYIVIGLDSIKSDMDPDTINEYILELRKILLNKYNDLTLDEINYYDDIVKFIKEKNKKGIIEGGNIIHISNISKLKGLVIVKRTARFKCYYRSSYRDFKNPAWRVGLSKWGLIKRFFYCFKRRFHHIFKQKHIEKFIDRLEHYKV